MQMMKLQAMMSSQKLGSSWSALLWSVWWETTKGPVVALPRQGPGHAAGPSVGDVQSHLVLPLVDMQSGYKQGPCIRMMIALPFHQGP